MSAGDRDAGIPPAAGAPATNAPQEVAGALAWSLVAKVAVSLLAIASNILIVRGLGEHAYGVYSIYLNIAHFLALGIGLGLAQAALQFLPEMRVRRDARGARQILIRGLALQAVGWIVVLGIVYLLRGWLSTVFNADLRTILPLGTALLLLETLWTYLGSLYTAMRRMRWLTVASVAAKLALIGLLVLLVRAGATVPGVLYVVGGSFLFGILVLAPGLRRLLPWIGEHGGEGLSPRRHLGFALPIALGALINQVLWRSSETLFIGHFGTPVEAGYYNAAYNLAQMVLEFVPLAIWPVILATLSEAHTVRPADLLRGTRLYFRLLYILVIPVALTGGVLGGEVFRVMYGAEMGPGAPLCQFFFVLFLIGFFATPLRMALYVKERAMTNAWISGAGALVNVALDLALIPRYGIWGGAWAVMAALLVSAVLQFVVSRRLLPGLQIPWGDFGRVLAASAIVVPFWWLRPSLDRPLPLLAALAGATLLQFLLLRAMRVFGPEERALLMKSSLPFKSWIVRLLGAPE
jgi:O-antigen/teichoic acid export membrane protein